MSKHHHHDDPGHTARGHHKHRHHNDQNLGSSNRGHHKHRHHDDHEEAESTHNSKISTKPSSPHKGQQHRSIETSPTAESAHSGSIYDGQRKVSTLPTDQASPSSRSVYEGHRKLSTLPGETSHIGSMYDGHRKVSTLPTDQPSPSHSIYDGRRKVSTLPADQPSPSSRSMYDGRRKVSTFPEAPTKKKETHDEISIMASPTSRENQQDKRSLRSDKQQSSSTNVQSKRDRNAEKMAGRQPQMPSLMERIFGLNKPPIVVKTREAKDAIISFGLTDNHLQRLRLSFDALDKDKSDSIDRIEFMNDIGERSSPYTDKLFRLIDSEDRGSFDFEQYICVVSSYCMFSKTQILHFCFECFDPMNSGYLDEEGFVSLCKYVNVSPPGFPQNFRAALKEFDENLDGYIDFKGEHLSTL